MRDYELLYILFGDLTEEAANQATDQVNAAIMKLGGKVVKEDAWGRKRLAYEISKQDHGWYVVSTLQLEPHQAAELSRTLGLQGTVLRSMLLQADEFPTEQEREVIERASTAAAATTKPAPKPKRPSAPAAAEPAGDAAGETPAKPAKKETAAEKKERQAKLEEKLGQILAEE